MTGLTYVQRERRIAKIEGLDWALNRLRRYPAAQAEREIVARIQWFQQELDHDTASKQAPK